MTPSVVTKRILSGLKERDKSHLTTNCGRFSVGQQNRAANEGNVDFGVEICAALRNAYKICRYFGVWKGPKPCPEKPYAPVVPIALC
jgi:hypothetical protein